MDEILNCIDERGVNRFLAEVSITAKPFFVSKGFNVIKEQLVNLRGVQFINFLMEKIK